MQLKYAFKPTLSCSARGKSVWAKIAKVIITIIIVVTVVLGELKHATTTSETLIVIEHSAYSITAAIGPNLQWVSNLKTITNTLSTAI